MKRLLIAVILPCGLLGGLLGAALAGCGSNRRDLEGIPLTEPSKVEIYANLDTQPNIVRLCIDGVALMTTSREYTSVIRVPEWDAWCKTS